VPSPHAAHIFAAPRHPRVPFRVRRSISTVDRTITIKRGECKGGLLSHCVRGPRAKCFREIFSCLSLQLSLPSPPSPALFRLSPRGRLLKQAEKRRTVQRVTVAWRVSMIAIFGWNEQTPSAEEDVCTGSLLNREDIALRDATTRAE